ncbi:bone morphogenetic protein 10 [Alosa sapidissima]|uniref:bone morphogenetic protein 10 n=1 Tax=Alosa sapidissima TaxID=34773 RepID=UPI001C09CF71|nr:bone morphogenetic protein 10 [Alosa sapidissima]
MVGMGLLQSRRLSFIMSPVLLTSLALLLCPPFGGGSPITAPERHRPAPGLDDGRGGVVDPSLLEQDSEVDVQKLLETLKGQFLRTFNLSGLGPRPQPGTVERVDPPEYMMELYNRFANDRTSMPTANIIRSFKNEDSSPCIVGPRGVRIHPLLFNVSLPHHERVTAAELRLYTLVQTDRHLYAGVDRKVTVYEVEQRYPGNSNGGGVDGGGGEANGDAMENGSDGGSDGGSEERTALVELASRQVYGMDDGWESFDMTAAVHRWRKSGSATTHRLEVHIASLDGDKDGEEEPGQTGGERSDRPAAGTGNMEIETSQEDRHRPLMIVFSDDQTGDHRGDRRELNEMIGHEAGGGNGLQDGGLNSLLEELGEMGLGLDADPGNGDGNEPDEEALMQMRSNLIYDTSSRIRRNAKGNHCKKNSLYVEFKDIGWDSWILAPNGYEAYECTGVCSFPLTPHVKPTKHALVQTLVNLKSPQKVAPACCVPTKLDPISLLYLDDAGVVTYKYKFEGMVVAECGCR